MGRWPPPKRKISLPSTKKGRFSSKTVSKAERFTDAGSTSTCPKSGFSVASSVRLLVMRYLTSIPAELPYSLRVRKGLGPGSTYSARATV